MKDLKMRRSQSVSELQLCLSMSRIEYKSCVNDWEVYIFFEEEEDKFFIDEFQRKRSLILNSVGISGRKPKLSGRNPFFLKEITIEWNERESWY